MRYSTSKKGEIIFKEPLLNKVLWMNGIFDKETYYKEIESLEEKVSRVGKENVDFSFPFKLDNTDLFIELIESHLDKKIVIVGDYDVDGVSATAIASKYLDFLEADYDWIIPNRFEDGYGLKEGMVDKAIAKGAEVIVTVDNGIKSKSAIEYAVSKGVPVLVTDHHQADEINFPTSAEVIVNPHVGNEGMNFKEICGAMVIFQLFYHHTFKKDISDIKRKRILADSFDIVAVATVADVMPMKYSNRRFVQSFVDRVRSGKIFNIGIKKMIDAQNINENTFTSLDIGFLIGPLVNAPGRLVSADIGVEIMTTQVPKDAYSKARECVEKNAERKEKTFVLKDIAFDDLDMSDNVHVVYVPNANEGLIGITSGQITEKTGKPSFVFTDSEHGVKGSGRSPLNFNLIKHASKILEQNPEWSQGYGGHSGAMGLSLKDKNIVSLFKKAMNKAYDELSPDELIKTYIDGDIFHIRSMKEVSEQLKTLEPYGETFEYPLFKIIGQISEIQHLGKRKDKNDQEITIKDHTLFRIEGNETKFLWFKNVMNLEEVGQEFEIFFQLSESEFRGKKSYDAFVKDVRKI